MEPPIEDRMEPEVEIGHEPDEYGSSSGFQRPRPPKPSFLKKLGIGLIVLAVLALLVLGTWVALPPGMFSNKPPGESPEYRAMKAELVKLRGETDLLKKEIQSLQEGQKTAQDQLGSLREQLKVLKENQAQLEKKAESPAVKKKESPAVTYKVKKGDTLKSIARKFQVQPEDIRRWNHLSGKSQPKVGEKITIYSSTAP
jgi:LysM repeat protein